MPLIKIAVKHCTQLFLQTQSSQYVRNVLDASAFPVMKDYVPSLVIRLPAERKVLKLIRARKPVEYVKMLWNRSRASKEINGNRFLDSIGVKVPAISESGLGLFPAKNYQFIGYYIMADLEWQGFENSRFLFLENRLQPLQRQAFIKNMLDDVRNMYRHSIVFNDLKLENIFCNATGDAVWIDTGVSRYPFWQKKKLARKHNDAIDYFILHHEKFLTADEISAIKALYAVDAAT